MWHNPKCSSYIVYVVTFSIFLSGYGDTTANQTAIWVMLSLFYADKRKLFSVGLSKSNV